MYLNSNARIVRNYKGLGITSDDLRSTALSTIRTAQTMEEILPAVKVAANDYLKISPAVNWLADYWAVGLTLVGLTVMGGAAFGSIVGQRIESERRSK